MEKQIKNFWIAGFFLPAINATVFNMIQTETLVFNDFFLSQFSGKMIKHNSRSLWKHEIPELANIVSGVCG